MSSKLLSSLALATLLLTSCTTVLETTNPAEEANEKQEALEEQTARVCVRAQDRILEALNEANHCATDADCRVSATPTCPFGCFQMYNKDEEFAPLRDLMQNYLERPECQQCNYEHCPAAAPAPMCKNGICVEKR